MSQLTFLYASMNAGKSTHLLQTNHNYIQGGMRTLLLTSYLDDRFGRNVITSRLGVSAEAISIKPTESINQHFLHELSMGRIDCIMVDESQFLTREQVDELSDIVDNYDIPVMCYGLRNDFQGEPFEGSMRLMAIADTLSPITSVCFCGKPATMVVRSDGEGRVVKSGEQVAIEQNGPHAKVNYHSVCRKHFKAAMGSEFYLFPTQSASSARPQKDTQAKA